MKITKIERQKRNRNRRSIWIDGEYSFSCGKETLVDLGLVEGQTLSASQLQTLLVDIQQKEAQNYSIAILARRPLSEAQLREKLRSRKYAPEVVSAVVSHLREIDLIDDLHYARLWIRTRVKTNPRGTLLLRKELRTKGVAAAVVEKALEEFKESYDETELLSRVAEGRAQKLTHLDRRARQRRLFNYLLRRGFPIDEVRSITRKY